MFAFAPGSHHISDLLSTPPDLSRRLSIMTEPRYTGTATVCIEVAKEWQGIKEKLLS